MTSHAVRRVVANVQAVDVLRRRGLLEPGLAAATTAATARWGASIVVPFAAAAARYPERLVAVDPEHRWTYRQLDQLTDRIAEELRHSGSVRGSAKAGVLVGNSAWFIVAVLAVAKAGVDVVLLNTGFGAPQLAEVIEREGITLVVHDPDLVPAGAEALPVRWVATAGAAGEDLAGLGRRGARPSLRPRRAGSPVLLTSGTTGTPKGAVRRRPRPDLAAATGVLERLPLRRGDVVVVPAPLFHAWGFAQLVLTSALAGTIVLEGRFDPHRTLEAVERHRASVLAVVPIMLQRMLDVLDAEPVDVSSLRVVAASGSALPGPLATRWMDATGDNLYNLYGSTEVGQIAVAGPEDLRAAPDTAGRPLLGVDVRLYGDDDRPVPPGHHGRIAARSSVNFDGYTGGGSKPVVDGFMFTGDIGRFDDAGRLYVLGRDDDMIVSGGENVFPGEVEDLLAARPEVAEVAVVGVPDEQFGQRLVAIVVPAPGHTVDPEALRGEVRRALARHKVPREVRIVDSLPRTLSGKVLRRNLGGS